jgi:uroporphyrinogen decarboxylase
LLNTFAVELNKKILMRIGNQVDVYRLWDDVAMQDQMILSPSLWDKYLKKWYKPLFSDAKKYGLKVMYHCCGSFHPIIPSLIDIGVDILDPIQTNALGMDLENLKRLYGKYLCFHGGIDVQHLIPFGSIEEIRKTVKSAKALFNLEGGLILGPSHEITPDTPIENILAIYN